MLSIRVNPKKNSTHRSIMYLYVYVLLMYPTFVGSERNKIIVLLVVNDTL